MNTISKSLWTQITNAAAATPAGTDLLLFAPQPGTDLVTDCKNVTVNALVAAGTTGVAAGQVAFGAVGGGLDGTGNLTWSETTETLTVGGVGRDGKVVIGTSEAGAVNAVIRNSSEAGGFLLGSSDNSGGWWNCLGPMFVGDDITFAKYLALAGDGQIGAVGSADITFGNPIKPTGYKSSDGTAGATISIVIPAVGTITVKNGLVTAFA